MDRKADIRVIRLFRKELGSHSGNSGSESYFATDYFDLLNVEEKALEDDFASIMGIEDVNAAESGTGETAMQSYTVYFSRQMQERYESGEKKSGERALYMQFENPFEDHVEKMPFLSIIQVHITPEIMNRTTISKESLWGDGKDGGHNILLEPFIEDLYDILKNFSMQNPEEICICRVYHVLSAGDFAVVVRSKRVETSYRISTLIRRRRAWSGDGKRNWVLYKTYTLLTMKNYIIASETEEETKEKRDETNQFVIRGCFSNKYWSERTNVENWVKNHDMVKKFFRLNGRYDFSIQLSEHDFKLLLPEIMEYKGVASGRIISKCRENPAQAQESTAVSFLRFLISNGYLSYINERYLLYHVDGPKIRDEDNMDRSLTVPVDDNRIALEDLKVRIARYIDNLLEKHTAVFEPLKHWKSYRGGIKQYVQLLRKQILLCRPINELSDTRVYALVLAEQLDCILESAKRYICLTEMENDSFYLLNLMEEYLAEAVYALDHYAQYIRNNNLQSLQTPNYNIESSMGMEKLLIGYGEFLSNFAGYYNCWFMGEKKNCSGKKLLPVVIPDLRRVGTSVEVLFQEGCGSSWKEEEELIGKGNGRNTFLTVVGCPTFAHLCNLPSTFSTLFHEIAHQLRYESREIRNRSLLKAVIERIVSKTVNRLEENRNAGLETGDDSYALFHTIIDAVTNAVLEHCFTGDGACGYNYGNAPLNSFCSHLFSHMESIVAALKYSMGWERKLENFLKEILFNNTWEDRAFKDFAAEMVENWENILYAPSEKDYKKAVEREEKYAFLLAVWSVYNTLGREERRMVKQCGENVLHSSASIKAWIAEDAGDFSDSMINMWNRIFAGISRPEVERNFQAFYRFCMWLDNNAGFLPAENKKKEHVEAIFRKMFEYSCDLWKTYETASKNMYSGNRSPEEGKETGMAGTSERVPFFSTWIQMGRYLGIDNNTKENCAKFSRIMARILTADRGDGAYLISRYREETSDLFMCSAIPLTPFGYVNLMAVNLPMENNPSREYDDIYIERMTHVIYEKWCASAEKNREKAMTVYRSKCMEILRNVYSYCAPCKMYFEEKGIAGQSVEQKFAILENSREKYLWENDSEETGDFLCRTILETVQVLEELKGMIINREADGKICDILSNACRICLITSRLIESGRIYISNLLEDKELEEDFKRGCHKLENLYYDMGRKADASITALADYCREIAKYFNAEGKWYRVDRLNEKGIEFLMRMFYMNKFRNTQEI